MDGMVFNNAAAFTANGLSYLTFDMWEIKGMYWTDASAGLSFIDFVAPQNNNPNYDIITNLYFHGWSHARPDSGFTAEAPYALWLGSTSGAPGQEVGWNVWDGSDSLDAQYYNGSSLTNCSTNLKQWPEGYCATMSGLGFEGYYVHDNRFKYLSNGMVTNNTHILANNVFERIYDSVNGQGSEEHGNGFEFNGEYPGNNLIYNNVLRFNTVAVTGWFNPNATDSVFNNVWYANVQQILDEDGAAGGVANIYNNTFVDAGSCIAGSTANYANNLFINSVPCGGSSVSSVSWSDNQARIAGYTQSNAYAPTSGTCGGVTPCGVGTGTALASYCATVSNSLCSDTTAGDTRAPVIRATWDIGAFQFGPGPNQPQPPKSLIATVD
jgi:hypothetical protein